VKRAPAHVLITAAVLAGLVTAGSAVAAQAQDASSRAIGAILPGGNVASAAASPAHPTRTARGGLTGNTASGGPVVVQAGAGPGGRGSLAEAQADAQAVVLFGGRVVVNSLHVGIRSESGADGTEAGVADWSADVVVDGQAIDEQPGTRVEIAGLGTLTLVERLVDGGTVTANALRIEVTDPASGLAPGTQVVLGHLEARTGSTTSASSSPDPGSAPSAPGSAPPAADGTVPADSGTGRSLPVAPISAFPSVGATGAATPVTTGGVTMTPGLGLPRRDPGAAMGVASTEGYAFPVLGESSFSDDYGAPRAGTGWHHGNDIFGAMGLPIVAVANGVLSKVGVNHLGGNRLWLTDDAGNSYYYAHLSAYAPGTADGVRVRAGQVIAFLGNTGQAITTPPHLHFEVHPGAGDSVDPYPYLLAWQRNASVAQAFTAATLAHGHVPAAGALMVGASPLDEGASAGEGDGLAVAVR